MKIFTTTMLVLTMSTTAIMTTIAYASEHMHERKGPSSSEQHHRHGQMQDMHEHMETMHEQMQAIHAEKDPERRKQLMQEHRKSMHEGMKMMHGMMGGGMMMGMHGDASKENGEKHKHGKGKGPMMDPESRMNMMEERMDMMQMMMEQMMQHEDAMHRQHHKQ